MGLYYGIVLLNYITESYHELYYGITTLNDWTKPLRLSQTTKAAMSHQMYSARNSRSVHLNHLLATRMFSYSAMIVDCCYQV